MLATQNNFHMYSVFCISKCIFGGSWCWLGEAWSADGSSWDPTSWRHFHPSFLPPAMPCPSIEACWSLGSVLSWHFWSFNQLAGDKFCQSRWRHFSSIQPFCLSLHTLSPMHCIFQSIWVVDTKAQLHQVVCQVYRNPLFYQDSVTPFPFFVPYPVLFYEHEDWKLASARDQFHLRSYHF